MKHKTSKLLSILLALALVMGIAPAMSQTAQAADGKRGIYIAANNPEAGVVSLNGTDWTESAEAWGFDIGSSATVYARVIDDDYVFDGWYEGSERKSSLTSYTFRVENDTVLEARFLKAASIVSAVQVKKSGGNDNFAADAPIATVRIDHSKLTKENVKLTYSANNNVDGYELAADGTVWAKDCAIDADYRNIGGFTLAFADAALLPDGTKKTLEIVFDQITVIRKSGAEGYFDDICVAGITGNPNGPIAFSPLSSEQKHMALRAEVTFKVNGVDEKDVFLFDARGINNVRGSQNFGSIVNASAHYNYSESMEPASGVVAGSHLYLPADSALRVETGSSSPTLGHRFVGGGTQNNGFNHGFAAAAQAKNGFQSRVWSSAGTNLSPLEIFFLGGGLSHELTVSSGDGGRTELWSDGKVDSATAQKLIGGTLVTPHTYDVPNGKEVTLKMTPQSGFEIGKLYVNGEETEATAVLDSAGRITHYTYTFDADQTEEQEIQVTWFSMPITEASVWWRYDSDTKTLHISGEEKDNYIHFPEAIQAKVGNGEPIPWRAHQAEVELAVIEGEPAPVSTVWWFAYMGKLKEIQNLTALDTSKATDMGSMFAGSSSLAELDVSGFDTSKATNMSGMFIDCSSLIALDVSGFDMSQVSTVTMMFYHCSSLETIYAAPGTDWWRDQEEGPSTRWWQHEDMFSGCYSLVGGSGTKYDTPYIYGEYARVDGLDGKPGYFTAVNYGIDLTPQSLDFGSAAYGYSAPAAKPVAVSNTGNQSVSFDIDPFTPQYFELIPYGTLSASENALQASGNLLSPSTTVSFQLKPKDNLAPGTYSETITVTWQGGKNETGTESVTVTFEVEKVPLTLGLTIESWTEGEAAKTPSLTGNAGNGAVTYEYKLATADEAAYSTTVPTAAGEYTVRATVAETANYKGGSITAAFIISAATVPVTVTGITLGSDNAKKVYTEGEALDVTGLTLDVSKSDGSKETTNATASMVSGFDNSKIGKQTLTVSYEGFTDTYEVEVKAEPDTPAPTYEATVPSVTWQKGSDKTLNLTINRNEDDNLTYGKFVSLEMDGNTVSSGNYGTAEGSLKLAVKPEYLETLSVGDHTVKVNFQDGSATVKLTVKAAENPKTSDESNLALWSSIMFLSIAALIVLLLYARKRKTER